MSEHSDATSSRPHGSGQLVVFTLGGEEYALPIEQVQEIIRFQEPRAVAADEPWVVGVISLRGKIIPVCDLGLRLGGEAHRRREGKIVVVDGASGIAGIIVDDVAEVLTVREEQLDALPGAGGDILDGVAKIDDRLVVVLDSERLFAGLAAAA